MLLFRSPSQFLVAFFAGWLTLSLQIVCTRLAIINFGADASTLSTVIIVSLLGLAAGSAALGNLADRTPRLQTLIAHLFLCTGMLSILQGVAAAPLADWLNTTQILPQHNGTLNRAIFIVLVCGPINFTLGGILPALIKHLTLNDASPTRTRSGVYSFGNVYSSESFGAAAGSVATAFILIPYLGIRELFWGCGVLATTIATAHYFSKTPGSQPTADPTPTTDHIQRESAVKKSDWILLVAIIMSSCAGLGMEVVWQRFFVVWFGSDTQSFAIVVATILIGVSVGAAISNQLIKKSKSLLTAYASILLLTSVSLILSIMAVSECNRNQAVLEFSARFLQNSPVWSRFLVAMLILIVPTTLMGSGLPVAAHKWIHRAEGQVGGRVGQILAAALFGNVIGVGLCGYVLVPNLGLRPTVVVLSGVCLAGALIVLTLDRMSTTPAPRRIAGRIAFCVIAAVWCSLAFSLSSSQIELGLESELGQWKTIFYSENSRNTVAVVQNEQNPTQKKMVIDGVAIGESGGGVDEKQQLLAHLPFLVRAEFKQTNVLTVGLGSGVLAAELLEIPAVGKVCCVELSEAVIEASQFFAAENRNLQEHNNFELVHADGLKYLAQAATDFDVIVSDGKSRPGHAGNVAFFSRDYYRLCQSRLASDGIFVQWVSLKSSSAALKMILRSFTGAFPYGHVAIAAPDSLFVVGSNRELDFNLNFIDRHLQQPYSKSLNGYDVNTSDDVLSFYWLDQAVLEQALDSVQPNTLNRPLLESHALVSYQKSTQKNVAQLDEIVQFVARDMADDFSNSYFNGKLVANNSNQVVVKKLIDSRRAAEKIMSANQKMLRLEEDWLDSAAADYKTAINLSPALTRQRRISRVYRQMADSAIKRSDERLQFSALLNIRELNLATAADELELGKILLKTSPSEQAIDFFYQATKKEPSNSRYRIEFAYCLLKLGRSYQALSQFQRVIQKSEDDLPDAQMGLGIAQLFTGKRQAANKNIQQALKRDRQLAARLAEFQIDSRIEN